jgi:phenylalanyl-tRNA synthetase beta chain
MRAPLSWLREYAALPEDLDGRGLSDALIRAGLEVETVDQAGADVTGPLVIGRVLDFVEEPQKNGKTIRWCQVDVGPHNLDGARGIVCGARNFDVGDFVVVSLPGAVLPGGFAIAARKTYGHVSDGMICSAAELGLGDDHSGIMVLPDPGLVPGADAAPVLELRDDVLDIAVTPDRGYCLSIRGLAREAAQATGVAFTDPVDRAVPLEITAGYPVELQSSACPIFVAITVTGVDPTRPSPRWLARRVQLAGMRSISLAVDITNYVMLETGQPIHAYDRDRLDGPIVVRQAQTARSSPPWTTWSGRWTPRTADHRRHRPDRAGRRDGRSVDRAVVGHPKRGDRGCALRRDDHRPDLPAAQAVVGGVPAVRARGRPAAGYAAAHRVAQLLVELAGGTLSPDETVRGSVLPQPSTTDRR